MYESFSNEELVSLFQKEKDPFYKEKILDKIIDKNMGLVMSQIEKYRKEDDPLFEDLVQLGKIALLKRARDFDERLGNKFSTYATEVIKGEIKNFLRDEAWLVKVPREEKSVGWKVHHLSEEGKTDEEIMETLDLDKEDFVHYKNLIINYRPSTTFEDEENSEEYLLENTISGGENIEYELTKKSVIDSIMSVLDNEERALRSLCLSGEYNKNDLAFLLGKTKEEINKMLNDIKEKIKDIPGIEEL